MNRVRLIVGLLCCLGISAFATAQTKPSGTPPASSTKNAPEPPVPSALKQLDAKYRSTKAAYLKSPKDQKKKDAYVEATVKLGHETMVSNDYPASFKYKKTLSLYKEALKLDPNNPVAKQESELIISIYKQMGRPVPKY
jgi:hypothetical protein